MKSNYNTIDFKSNEYIKLKSIFDHPIPSKNRPGSLGRNTPLLKPNQQNSKESVISQAVVDNLKRKKEIQ